MKTLNVTCDHFHFSGVLTTDSSLCKELKFDVHKPAEVLILSVKAAVINTLRLELRFISFRNNVLTMHILSEQKIVNLLIGLLNRYIREIPYLEIDYPSLRVNTLLLSKTFFPEINIRNIGLDGEKYLIEMELN
jgi:hypothetical protein